MFIEADRCITPFRFGKAELWFRYDNMAFLNIEKDGYEPLNILKYIKDPKAVRSFLRHGLYNWGKAYGYSDNDISDTANILMLVEEYSDDIIITIENAVISALPPVSFGKKKENNKEKWDVRPLMTCFCDIMGRSTEEFWSSTLREIHERWERYGMATGKIKPVEEFSIFDDD